MHFLLLLETPANCVLAHPASASSSLCELYLLTSVCVCGVYGYLLAVLVSCLLPFIPLLGILVLLLLVCAVFCGCMYR